jgi:hypothetical protein
MNEFFQFTESFQPHWALGITQPLKEMSIRSIEIMFLGSKMRPVRMADKLTAMCEQIVLQCAIFNISQPYRPPRPVTRIAFVFYFFINR